MALLFEHFYIDLLAVLTSSFIFLIWYLNNNFSYWKKKGVFYIKPELFFGNVKEATLMRKHLGDVMESLYWKLGDRKFAGVYQNRTPVLLVKDPDMIKTIMVKDFGHFQDRGIAINTTSSNAIGQHLFFVGGDLWRWLRTKLSPTFTSGKMKMMFHLVDECSHQLSQFLEEPAANNEIIDVREVLAKFSTDVIGTCAFGLKFNAITDPDSEFRRQGREVFNPTPSKNLQRMLLLLLPTISNALGLNPIAKETNDFFLKVVKDTVQYRLKNNVTRKDFLQLLIELQKEGKQEEKTEHSPISNGHHAEPEFELTDELLAAQVFVFFLAGFETSSTAMSVSLFEMAMNKDIQNRLRDEVDAVLRECNGNVTYEAIHKMEYMDKVVSESLRKYPPLPVLNRECTTPYTIPGTDIKLEKGSKVIIPVLALQHDPQYFPDPEKYDPERFSPENKAKRHHYVYLPFGEGPRNCIGLRFGLLQTKMGLFFLVAKYEFSICEKTSIPLEFDPKAAITASVHGTYLRISNRN